MKVLMMVLMVVLMGCNAADIIEGDIIEDDAVDPVVVDDDNVDDDNPLNKHCSRDTELYFNKIGNEYTYDITVNGCNSITYVNIFSDKYIKDNPGTNILISVTKKVSAIEGANKVTDIHYTKEGFHFRALGAEVNGYSEEYIYNYKYGNKFIGRENLSGGGLLYIYSYDYRYERILIESNHNSVLAEFRKSIFSI